MLDGTGRDSPLKLGLALYGSKTSKRHQPNSGCLPSLSHQDEHRRCASLLHGKAGGRWCLADCEHGNYPFSPTGNHQYPKRRFWRKHSKSFATAAVSFRFSSTAPGRQWDDAKLIYDTARELKIPLMRGSSVPGTWRYPPADVIRNAKISEIVAFTYGTTDAYGSTDLKPCNRSRSNAEVEKRA